MERVSSASGTRSSRRLAILIIALVVLLPVLGVASAAIWGDGHRETPVERPSGSGGGFGL